MMDLNTIKELASSQYVWAILFIATVWFGYQAVKAYINQLRKDNETREQKIFNLYETQKEESIQREERLMEHLKRTTNTLEAIDINLKDLNHRVERMEGNFFQK